MNNELLEEHAYRIGKGIELGIFALGKAALFPISLRKSLEPVPEVILGAYEEVRPEISRIYGDGQLNDDYLFHGTGRYHYKANGNHKYDDFMNDQVVDALETVLTTGLQPQTDIWMPTPGNSPTVSLTNQRFYSRWYADKHNYAPLEWSFGNSADWAFMYIVRTIGDAMSVPYIFMLLRTMSKKDKGLLGSAQKWVSDVRNDLHSRSDYSVVWKSKSTIENNFGVVIGMKKSEIRNYDLHLLKRSESRTTSPISPDKFAVIEVPLKFVSTVRELTEKLGHGNLVVLPIECVDYHLSKLPLNQLTQMSVGNAPIKPGFNNISDVENVHFENLSKTELLNAARGQDLKSYSPHELLAVFDKDPILHSLLSQKSNWEGYTLRYHTLCGLTLLEKYFKDHQLPDNMSMDFFKVFVAMHDIGDSLGKTTESKLAFNRKISANLFKQLGFEATEIEIVSALLSDDPIGSYLKKMGAILELSSHLPQPIQQKLSGLIAQEYNKSLAEAKKRIDKMAHIANINYSEFLQVLTLFHMVDAGSYTRLGGSIGTLDYVFSISENEGTMKYSDNIQPLVDALI